MVEYTADSTEYSLRYEYGSDWTTPAPVSQDPNRRSPDTADPSAVLLHLCLQASESGDHKAALEHARAAREHAQEALVSAVEADGFMPVFLVRWRPPGPSLPVCRRWPSSS